MKVITKYGVAETQSLQADIVELQYLDGKVSVPRKLVQDMVIETQSLPLTKMYTAAQWDRRVDRLLGH